MTEQRLDISPQYSDPAVLRQLDIHNQRIIQANDFANQPPICHDNIADLQKAEEIPVML